MKSSTFMTPEDCAVAQRNFERCAEHVAYMLENPAEQDRLNGATIVFDEEGFARAKNRNDGRRVVLVQKTYRHTYG